MFYALHDSFKSIPIPFFRAPNVGGGTVVHRRATEVNQSRSPTERPIRSKNKARTKTHRTYMGITGPIAGRNKTKLETDHDRPYPRAPIALDEYQTSVSRSSEIIYRP